MVNKVTPDTMLSASRLPAVMGLSKWSTPNDELEFSINALNGKERPDIGNEAMEWGNTLEPVILAEAAKRLQLSDVITDHAEAVFHDVWPLAASLDGTGNGNGKVVVSDPDAGIYVIGQDSITLDGIGVIEAKATKVQAEDVPALYRGPVQLQAQMSIVKAQWGCVAVLYQGSELRLFLFAPHQPTLKAIKNVSTEFQQKLDDYEATGIVEYYEPQDEERWPLLRGNYPVSEETLALPNSAEMVAHRINEAKKKMQEAETEFLESTSKLKELMGDATKATAGKYVISWPVRTYKDQPEKVTPAKAGYAIRQSTLILKETV